MPPSSNPSRVTLPEEFASEPDAEQQFADADANAMRTLGAFLMMQTHRACSPENTPPAEIAAHAVADVDALFAELNKKRKKA